MGTEGVARGRTAVPLRLDAALLILMWAFALATYPRLPDAFPIHFDLAGRADGFARRGPGGFVLWLLLPATATLLSLGFRWAARAGWKNPHFWNVPHKKAFVALGADERAPIQALLEEAMAWLGLLCSALLATLQWLTFLSARAAPLPALVVTAIVFLLLVVIVLFGHRAGRRAHAAIEAATQPTGVPR